VDVSPVSGGAHDDDHREEMTVCYHAGVAQRPACQLLFHVFRASVASAWSVLLLCEFGK